MDCLLFGTTIKDKSRLFRVQFSGESKEQALEHCCSCVQKLAQYITVQVPDGNIQELQLIPGPPRTSGSQRKDSAKSVPWQAGSHQHSEQQERVTAGTGAPDGRTSLTQLAQVISTVFFIKVESQLCKHLISIFEILSLRQQDYLTCYVYSENILIYKITLLASEELPRIYEQSAWGAEELGPFLRLCLMDQNFPAFVEDVEKELKKLAGLRN
ncbi:PREDICTED: meiotic recombination protein REC114 [Rhinopithecus bieti]|uniref:meiotic recombination protein REC114 n=1 Tax=Rhinopithecus bieti TaxID=61621 RepID=UPI00083C4C42|nr:PREDICTED: meiotic recombination protein REC114 [Rhinopithecus bieti]